MHLQWLQALQTSTEIHAVILDLEDAVAPAAKESARKAVAAWFLDGGSGYVRVNAEDTQWYRDDIAALLRCPTLQGIVVSKAERADSLAELSRAVPDGVVLLPLIETALAFDSLGSLARTSKVERLLFGTLDFQVDTGIRGDGDELMYFRSQLTLVSRTAGLAAPVDGVTASIDDAETIRRDAARARNLGFRGKLCIHPKQIEHVHAAFKPSSDEVAWAQKVMTAIAASNGSATAVDGKMVDAPVILKAQDILNCV